MRLLAVVCLLCCGGAAAASTVVADEGAWCWFADPRALHYENTAGTINATWLGHIDVHGNVKATQYNWLSGRKTDVLVGISFPRYSARTLEMMRFARHCGAQVIAITDGPMSPLCETADVTLTARTDMASFVDSLAAPLSLINALLVSLGLRRREALGGHLRQLESVWETYRVYLEEDRHA